jgi:hypothetical protein
MCMFSAQLGDPDADAVLDRIRRHEAGLTGAELYDDFGRNWKSERIQLALKTLIEHGVIIVSTVPTKGRPATQYRAVASSHAPHAYVEYALNALNAQKSSASSGDTDRPAKDSTQEVTEDFASGHFSRTSYVDSTLQGDQPPSSNGDLSPLLAFNASLAPVASPKAPDVRCHCGKLDWIRKGSDWRCHSCGAQP